MIIQEFKKKFFELTKRQMATISFIIAMIYNSGFLIVSIWNVEVRYQIECVSVLLVFAAGGELAKSFYKEKYLKIEENGSDK